MNLVEPSSHFVDVARGRLETGSGRYKKRLKDLAGLYADEAAYAAAVGRNSDLVVYEVTEQRPSADHGDLTFGVTSMRPGRVGDEFFMTRGHIHAPANRPETYYGEAGEGVLLLESPDGAVRLLEIRPRILCYVPPMWIHRSVNTGLEQLVMSFCYPSDSGQDYDVIARSGGMRSRIVADGSGWKEVPNVAYRTRTEEEKAAMLATTVA